jgi:adenosine deaminase
VNTDDPSVSRITLTHEYKSVCENLGIPLDSMKQYVINAAQAAFLPEAEKAELVAGLKKEMKM